MEAVKPMFSEIVFADEEVSIQLENKMVAIRPHNISPERGVAASAVRTVRNSMEERYPCEIVPPGVKSHRR